MSIKAQQKTTIPHEAVELLINSSNQLSITGPNHQITTINNEELDSTAHTVMFTTMETSASAAIALPTNWGQKRGVLVVLGKSQEAVRYYGSDIAAKGGDINSAPVWYRAKRPILGMTVRGVLAVLQTASEFIVLMSDAVTCREVAVHPIVASVPTGSKSRAVVVRAALTEMSRGAATFIAATTITTNTNAVLDISAFTITSASMVLAATQSVAKTPLATAHLAINPEAGLVAVPVYNDESKTSVGITVLSALHAPGTAAHKPVTSDIAKAVKKVLAITALPSKRWLVIAPVVGEDDFNAALTIVGADGATIVSEKALFGNTRNSVMNKIEHRLITGVVPSTGRVIVLNGHEVNTVKITLSKTLLAVEGGEAAAAAKPATSLAAAFKSAKAAATAAPSSLSSSRLANWSDLIDATAADVFTLLDKADGSDDATADAVADALINLSDLPELSATALSHLPFVEWFRAAKAVANIHSALKIAHLIFVAALKRGAIGVCAIAARAFDALYTRTGDDESSAHLAYEMRHCLQQISLWTNEQMGKQIGVVTVHCAGKSPALKQAMFVPHQPFAVSVKRHADIERTSYATNEPSRRK